MATVHIDVRADTPPPIVKTVTTTAGSAEDWPCSRGAAGDNNSPWIPKGLPSRTTPRWKSPLTGAAYSGLVVSGRCLVVMDTVKDQQDMVRCLSADTGKELWKHAYPNRGKSIPWGSCPRATPAISGRYMVPASTRYQPAVNCSPLTSRTGMCFGRRTWPRTSGPICPPGPTALHPWWSATG